MPAARVQKDHHPDRSLPPPPYWHTQKATGKLSRHVFRKREQLLTGINNVASVEDDLKAAFMITRSSRASLKQSGEEIMRNMRVVGQTRRKQHYMELLEVRGRVGEGRQGRGVSSVG